MSIDPATYDFYQSQAPHFSLSTAVSYSRHLDAFLDRLSPGASVLEIGCGAGRDAARIKERGFDLDATDGIPAMVSKAKERHEIDVRLMRFDELDAIEIYDAVWAHACLLHCPRAELPGVLARIHRSLLPGGIHYASFKLGNGEGRDVLGRLHNFPDAGWIKSAYECANFRLLEEDIFRGNGSDGTMRDWIALTVQRP